MDITMPTKLTDCHGEFWFENEDGTYRNEHSTPGYLDEWRREDIEREWGPVTVS